jgi:hypothetical protein
VRRPTSFVEGSVEVCAIELVVKNKNRIGVKNK